MKESGRVSLLVVSIVLAAGVFAGLWVTRPASDNEMIELAKQRQLQPLMEIDKPARLSVTEDEQNKKLANELYPYISEQIVSDQKISDAILSNVGDALDKRLGVYTADTLPSQLQVFQDKLQQELDAALTAQNKKNEADFSDLRVNLSNELDDRLVAQDQKTDVKLSGLTTDLSKKLDDSLTLQDQKTDARLVDVRAQLSKELDAYLPQAVDAMIPDLVTAIVKVFVDNQDSYVPQLQQMLKPYQTLDEAQAVALYTKYRDQIVLDLVPVILDRIETGVKPVLQEKIETMEPSITPVVSETAPVVSETAPMVSETTPVVSETTPVVSETAPMVSETTPVVSETTPVVSETTPVVSETTPVVSETTP
ncbi:MAG: hypothetical protein WCR02_05300, partial [Sphaerochaetaceae bacterium]